MSLYYDSTHSFKSRLVSHLGEKNDNFLMHMPGNVSSHVFYSFVRMFIFRYLPNQMETILVMKFWMVS